MYNSRLCNYFDTILTILMRDNTRFGWNWLKITLYLKLKMILKNCFRCVHVNSKYYQNMSRHPWTVATAPQGALSPTLRTPALEDTTSQLEMFWNVLLTQDLMHFGQDT